VSKVAVIGLGRFGASVAKALAVSGVHVLAMDRNAQIVNDLKDDVEVAVRLDATDKQALLSQDVDKVDVCIVSIGENFEAALLTTVLVKQLGVPMIICRAQTQFHAEIFTQIGANRVIQPERETGLHLARQLANPHLVDIVKLAEGYSLFEYRSPIAFHGKSLSHLGLRQKYHVNLVVIKRPKPQPDVADDKPEPSPPAFEVFVPGPEDVIQEQDIMVVVGADESLAKLPKE